MLFVSKIFCSETTRPFRTKLDMNIPEDILQRSGVGIFDLSKNMVSVTKNKTKGSVGSFSHTSPKPLGSAKFFQLPK